MNFPILYTKHSYTRNITETIMFFVCVYNYLFNLTEFNDHSMPNMFIFHTGPSIFIATE